MSDQPAPSERSPAATALAVAVLLAFATGMVAFCVRPGEAVVVTTFGSPARAVTEPGLTLKLPWPVQAVHRFDRRLQSFTAPIRQAITSDKKTVQVELYALWRVDDPLTFLERDGSTARGEEWLERELATQLGASVGGVTLDQLLAAPADEEPFGGIEDSLTRALRPVLAGYGVVVEQIGVRRLALPEAVTAAVLERMTAERRKAAEELLAAGTTEAGRISAVAEAAYEQTVGEAEAEALRIEGEAEKEAAASYRVFAQSPELAEFLQEVDALADLVDDQTTIVIEAGQYPGLRQLTGGAP